MRRGRTSVWLPCWFVIVVWGVGLLFGGCGKVKEPEIKIPPPLKAPSGEVAETETPITSKEAAKPEEAEGPEKPGQKTGVQATPKLPISPEAVQRAAEEEEPLYEGPKVEVNFDSLPMPAFINEVYGNILKVSFEIDPSIQKKKDLVTLRAAEPLPPGELDRLARQVLGNYGVTVTRQGTLLRFAPGKKGTGEEPPLMVSGRTLPEVPVSHRPIFQLVPLNVVRNTHVAGWLRQAYSGQNLEIMEDTERNAILLNGPPEIIQKALEAIKVLDRPFMRGRHSIRIEPVYLTADQLAGLLIEVLISEGYSAARKPGQGNIIVLPIQTVGAILIFAADSSVLEHARQWAETLDRPGREPEEKKREKGLHYYQVRNTQAKEIHGTLVGLLSGMSAKKETPSEDATKTKTKAPGEQFTQKAAATAATNLGGGLGLVVDEVRNGLIFQGDTETWQQLLPIIREMDRPPRMVLIEVTVAEITLNNGQELGVEWLLTDLGIKGMTGTLGTMGALGVGSGGMSYVLDNAGVTRAVLNAFAQKSQVTILSTPRIVVKSGFSASIDVGTEIPTVTRQSTSSDVQEEGTSGIIQEIQYRKTGILLSVKPVVHSGNRIDLEISQEVSESQPAASGSVNSPSIFTRSIDTAMGLRDGGSVLLGGLISSTNSKGYTGVPLLSEIPVVGRAFRVESEEQARTELIMLIVPYVLENDQDAEAVTEAFKQQLSTLGPE